MNEPQKEQLLLKRRPPFWNWKELFSLKGRVPRSEVSLSLGDGLRTFDVVSVDRHWSQKVS
jgi:hypothetical protein